MRNGTHRRNGGRIVKLGKSEEGKFIRRQNYGIKIERERENHKAKYNCIVCISFEGNASRKGKWKVRTEGQRIRIRYLNLKENHVKDRSKRVYLTGISNKQRPKKSYKIVREIRKALKPYFLLLAIIMKHEQPCRKYNAHTYLIYKPYEIR